MREFRTLINAIARSIFPVLQALVIIIVFLCVWAIVATQLFGSNDFEKFGLSLFREYGLQGGRVLDLQDGACIVSPHLCRLGK